MGMNLTELIAKVNTNSSDSSYSDATITAYLNEAALYIAERVRLPALAVGSGTVATDGTGLIAMPADYHFWLYRCNGGLNTIVNVRESYEQLVTIYGGIMTGAGAVVDVSVQGSNLYHQPIPAAPETLTLFYSILPTTLVSPGYVTPVFLPTRYHRTLVWYTLVEIYNEIEQEKDGSKPQTDRYSARLESDIAEMKELYKNSL
jgi:hypothetical protein